MRPITFDNCFGEFYPGSTRKGVVLCSSFGLEDARYQPALSQLAQVLAERGLNVVRFDLFGTGDSAGTTLDPDLLQRWTGNVIAAGDWLRKQANVESVSYIGLRMGAIIAALAAKRPGDLDELILLAPPASGETFIAEMTRAARLIQEEGSGMENSFINLAGFRIDQSTIEAISAFDWMKLDRCHAGRVKIMAENRLADRQAMSDVFSRFGCQVTVRDGLKGFERALSDIRASRRNVPEWDTIAALVDVPPGGRAVQHAVDSIVPTAGAGYLETPVVLNSRDGYAGIFCQSNNGLEKRMAVIILPGTSGYSLSWPRLAADLSRRLARMGFASLRLNATAGAGRSRGFEGQREPVGTLMAALDWLKSRRCAYITLVGTTDSESGDLHVAGMDGRVNRLLLLDRPAMPLGKGSGKDTGRASDAMTALSGEQSGDAALGSSMSTTRRAVQSLQRIADLANDQNARILPLEERLQPATGHKPVMIVHCEGAEPSKSLANFDGWSGNSDERAGREQFGNVKFTEIASTDGSLSSDRSRNGFGDIVIEFLEKNMVEDKDGYRLSLRAI